MSSASEAELAALYYGCKQAAPIRVTLEEMGHPQPAPTPITTDNITAKHLLNTQRLARRTCVPCNPDFTEIYLDESIDAARIEEECGRKRG